FRIGPKRWRTFRRVEHTKPAAGPSPDINQPTALLKRRDHQVNRFDHILAHRLHRSRGTRILRVHDRDRLRRRHRVEVHRFGQTLFGEEIRSVDHGVVQGYSIHGFGVIEPRTTARFAPVTLGTFDGTPSSVAALSKAKARASFASLGTPNSSVVR